MSPKKWHYRVPFFGKEVNDSSIIVNGNTAETMGQELAYAAEHGIKFWSFCNYPIGCTNYHPPDSDCQGIQCCAYVDFWDRASCKVLLNGFRSPATATANVLYTTRFCSNLNTPFLFCCIKNADTDHNHVFHPPQPQNHTNHHLHQRDNVGLSYAWNLYLNHPDNHKVNFTLLLQPGYWFPTGLKGGNETLAQEIDRYIH